MRGTQVDVCGCFPTGRHYPGIADLLLQAGANVEGLWPGFEPQAPWIDLPLAVIDFETTGFDEHHDRVVEIGIACFLRGELIQTKSWLVHPGMSIPEQAINVHGITDAMVADAPRFEQVAREVCDVLEGHLPVAYNASFDRKFLRAELARAGLAEVVTPAADARVVWIDPLVWVRELMADAKSKRLGDICTKLAIPLSDAHRAWADAEAAGRVLFALADRMPRAYAELVRIQAQCAARQEAALADWRRRRT